MGEAAGAWTAVVGAAFALLNWLYSSSRIEDECVKEDAHIPVGDAGTDLRPLPFPVFI